MLYYAITDPFFYQNLEQSFLKFNKLKQADFILLRDKISPNYAKKAQNFIKLKNNFNSKFILHNELDLAIKLKSDGIHFSSDNIDNLQFTPKTIYKIASTHNIKEIERAIKFGTDAVTISPIFDTPNKKNPIGIEKLKELLPFCKCKVFALGGIVSQHHINLCEETGVDGIASIRYFIN